MSSAGQGHNARRASWSTVADHSRGNVSSRARSCLGGYIRAMPCLGCRRSWPWGAGVSRDSVHSKGHPPPAPSLRVNEASRQSGPPTAHPGRGRGAHSASMAGPAATFDRAPRAHCGVAAYRPLRRLGAIWEGPSLHYKMGDSSAWFPARGAHPAIVDAPHPPRRVHNAILVRHRHPIARAPSHRTPPPPPLAPPFFRHDGGHQRDGDGRPAPHPH